METKKPARRVPWQFKGQQWPGVSVSRGGVKGLESGCTRGLIDGPDVGCERGVAVTPRFPSLNI